MPPPRLMCLLLASLGCGCAGPMAAGQQAYEQGRYPEALAAFESALPERSAESAPHGLRYALLRGLTHLSLGDARQAVHWLAPVKRAVDSHPDCLSVVERARLLAAWRSMGWLEGRVTTPIAPGRGRATAVTRPPP